MYIRVETMIPIAGILMEKGVSSGIVIALILGGAGCSIPEVSLLNSIFKKPMVDVYKRQLLVLSHHVSHHVALQLHHQWHHALDRPRYR